MKAIYNLVLIDDHQMFREIIAEKLNKERMFKVVSQFGNISSFKQNYSINPDDIILLDIDLPDGNGIEIVDFLMGINPDIKIIIISFHEEPIYISKFIKSGARAFISKSKGFDEILDTLYSVAEKGFYFSEEVNFALINSFIRKHKVKFSYPTVVLTEREIEIIKLICKEKTAKEIASLLFIEAKTVEGHKKNIMTKLNVKSSVGIALYASNRGLLD